MRFAFFYPSQWVRIPIDVENIWTAPRGLTGSEIACVVYAIELARMGHEVHLFTKINNPESLNGVSFHEYEKWPDYLSQQWDALCSWMTPEPLKIASRTTFRFFNQQCADLDLCESGWESYVDVFAPLSHSHARHMAEMTGLPKDQWRILNNGVYTAEFQLKPKTPGKLIWASSHDRGLHWLLEAFPKIKREVPDAELHVFYDFDGLNKFSQMEMPANGELAELVYRSKYTKEAIRRLGGKGVYSRGSVSRDKIKDEMASAKVLAYPCDPVRFTETFGVVVLEACASGTVPVLCTADAFGELWSEASICVSTPYPEHRDDFIGKVIWMLTDQTSYDKAQHRCVTHAKKFEWSIIAKQLETTLVTRGEEGLPRVRW